MSIERSRGNAIAESEKGFFDRKAVQAGAVGVGGLVVVKEYLESSGHLPFFPDIVPYDVDVESVFKGVIGAAAASWGVSRLGVVDKVNRFLGRN